jgi:hypothetical protein
VELSSGQDMLARLDIIGDAHDGRIGQEAEYLLAIDCSWVSATVSRPTQDVRFQIHDRRQDDRRHVLYGKKEDNRNL